MLIAGRSGLSPLAGSTHGARTRVRFDSLVAHCLKGGIFPTVGWTSALMAIYKISGVVPHIIMSEIYCLKLTEKIGSAGGGKLGEIFMDIM
jgi:hypothetical protein